MTSEKNKNKCFVCNSDKVKIVKEDYKYIESGLDNVVLKDIDIYKCENCGEIMPELQNIEKIHENIANEIINKESLLKGQEIKFLRKQLGITAQKLADALNVSKITVSRWENNHEDIGHANDKLLRLYFNTTDTAQKLDKRYKLLIEEIKHLETKLAPIGKPTKTLNALVGESRFNLINAIRVPSTDVFDLSTFLQDTSTGGIFDFQFSQDNIWKFEQENDISEFANHLILQIELTKYNIRLNRGFQNVFSSKSKDYKSATNRPINVGVSEIQNRKIGAIIQ